MVSPIGIFCCYAHEDQLFLKELKKHLKPLARQGLIQVWDDRNISPGTEWEEEIYRHLNRAQIILLLISPDFMASDYCYSKELKQAMKRMAGNRRTCQARTNLCVKQQVAGKATRPGVVTGNQRACQLVPSIVSEQTKNNPPIIISLGCF